MATGNDMRGRQYARGAAGSLPPEIRPLPYCSIDYMSEIERVKRNRVIKIVLGVLLVIIAIALFLALVVFR